MAGNIPIPSQNRRPAPPLSSATKEALKASIERLHAAWPDLPILLYTGYGEDFVEANLQRAGIRGVLRKPVDPQQLFSALQSNLAGV